MRQLCLSFRFIQPFPLYHGRSDGGTPEWPPSPMRAFQAVVNAAGLRTRCGQSPDEVDTALRLLERLCPTIIAPRTRLSSIGYRAYVPHNHADLVAAAWTRGRFDESIASHRIEKDHRPHRLDAVGDDLPAVHYVYPLELGADPSDRLLKSLRPTVRSVTHLGWGIDQVVADAALIDDAVLRFEGERWSSGRRGGTTLRVPKPGALDELAVRYEGFLNRLVNGSWTPVRPLSMFDLVSYRRETDPVGPPYAVFRLLDDNEDQVAYPHSKLVHLAGMVRHLATERMKLSPPRDLRGIDPADWVRAYVAGHQSKEDKEAGVPHTQFSYVPLQSIGHEHTDPAVRRVMVIAPVGDEAWLEHLAVRLEGQLLKPLPNTTLPEGTRLERIADRSRDGVRDAYTRPATEWASVTPVILPGHDDHKPEKTKKLILKSLAQSGVDQPCEFDWSPYSRFRKMLGAHKYVRDENAPGGKRPVNYIRPDHLLDQTAVHLTLRFGRREVSDDPESRWIPADPPVPGPITIGAGRHCGFGLMAAVRE